MFGYFTSINIIWFWLNCIISLCLTTTAINLELFLCVITYKPAWFLLSILQYFSQGDFFYKIKAFGWGKAGNKLPELIAIGSLGEMFSLVRNDRFRGLA